MPSCWPVPFTVALPCNRDQEIHPPERPNAKGGRPAPSARQLHRPCGRSGLRPYVPMRIGAEPQPAHRRPQPSRGYVFHAGASATLRWAHGVGRPQRGTRAISAPFRRQSFVFRPPFAPVAGPRKYTVQRQGGGDYRNDLVAELIRALPRSHDADGIAAAPTGSAPYSSPQPRHSRPRTDAKELTSPPRHHQVAPRANGHIAPALHKTGQKSAYLAKIWVSCRKSCKRHTFLSSVRSAPIALCQSIPAPFYNIGVSESRSI